MSYNITHKDPSKQPCGCNTQDIKPSKLDALIAKYKTLLAETEIAKQRYEKAAEDMKGVAMEANATTNRDKILSAIKALATEIRTFFYSLFEECTEADIYAMFEDDYLRLSEIATEDTDPDGYMTVRDIPVNADGDIMIAETGTTTDKYIIK